MSRLRDLYDLEVALEEGEMRIWHMIAAWLDFPDGCTDPDEGEAREEEFVVEAADLDAALTRGRELYPHAVVELAWVEWEPWPGLVLQIGDYHQWETVYDGPWTGHGSILLRDAAPLPEGLERESLRITVEKVDALIRQSFDYQKGHEHDRGHRVAGWRVEGESGDRWLVHDEADALRLDAKSLGDDHAACLAHPRVRQIVAGPHHYAPILGLDEHGEVVCVTIGRKA